MREAGSSDIPSCCLWFRFKAYAASCLGFRADRALPIERVTDRTHLRIQGILPLPPTLKTLKP